MYSRKPQLLNLNGEVVCSTMGNGQQRYTSNADAKDILSSMPWAGLKKQLEKYHTKYLDFEAFESIIRHRFDLIVSLKFI